MNGKEGEWENHVTIIQRSKVKIQPKGRNEGNNYIYEFRYFRQTSKSFTESWTQLKRKFDPAKNSSTKCEEHKDCKSILVKINEEELISYIYIGVKEKVRDLIDQLPDDHHKLGKYIEVGENNDMSHLMLKYSNY